MSTGVYARAEQTCHSEMLIKIPDRGCDQECEWRHAPEAWAEIWEKSVSWVPASEQESWVPTSEKDSWLLELAEALRQVPHMVKGADGKVIIERLCFSLPYVEKPFHSKVIKSFVPELRSRQVFFVFRDSYVIYICALWTLWTFCVPVWICLFHVFISGYVTHAATSTWPNSYSHIWAKWFQVTIPIIYIKVVNTSCFVTSMFHEQMWLEIIFNTPAWPINGNQIDTTTLS